MARPRQAGGRGVSLGDNTLRPLLIEDAREAEHAASELQRGVEDRLRRDSAALAEAERAYRKRLSQRILAMKAKGFAITACKDIARGEKDIADLRYARDIANGMWEATRQEAFRRGADRKAVGRLTDWSRARDLRTDTPPAEWREADVIGGRRAAA